MLPSPCVIVGLGVSPWRGVRFVPGGIIFKGEKVVLVASDYHTLCFGNPDYSDKLTFKLPTGGQL